MLENLERTSLRFEQAGDEVKRLVEGGEGLATALREVGERIEDRLFELADPAAEIGSRLGELSARVTEVLGERLGGLGPKLESLVQSTIELVIEGTEWLREHPEVVAAAAQLGALVVFGYTNPELLIELLKDQPGAVEDIIRSFDTVISAFA